MTIRNRVKLIIFAFTFWALFMIWLLGLSAGVQAHPGRLDKDGCHLVKKDYRYKSGVVAKAGEFHCHRTFKEGEGGLKLDGLETFQEEKAREQKAKTVR